MAYGRVMVLRHPARPQSPALRSAFRDGVFIHVEGVSLLLRNAAGSARWIPMMRLRTQRYTAQVE